ncbi:MAG TPA: FAD:protein FMN transferase [Verrucomicrobiae bacterium]|nr:FAD:protein FMN transferase [Verrucomicrobiae bacterium]
MATRFEILLHGENPTALRAAGEAALAEIERLENQLSLYRNTSEIAHVNARAAREPVRVSGGLLRLLWQARALGQAMDGAFDVTIAPLVRCWGFMGGAGHLPEAEALAQARAQVGHDLLDLDEQASTVRFARDGVMIDLGAIGKGYAIASAADVLREAGVNSAILHGGTSTVYALGSPPGGEFWKVAIARPEADSSQESRLLRAAPEAKDAGAGVRDGAVLEVMSLRDEALSVSAVWGRAFVSGGKSYGHVIDPRSGQPVQGTLLAAVALPSATETDAFSTALLTFGSAGLARLAALRPEARALVLSEEAGGRGLRAERLHIH